MSEIYISTDIESDGPIPGPNSMLSYGSAAFMIGEGLISTFTENLLLLPGAKGDPDTLAWWGKPEQAEAWKACRRDMKDPQESMRRYVDWLEKLSAKHNARPVFVGYPATFDFSFVYHYLITFVGRSPFSFSALDIKSYAMAKLGTEFRETTKKRMPKNWFVESPHTHVALDDAIEQGWVFMNMLNS
jgi:hypothetical protein